MINRREKEIQREKDWDEIEDLVMLHKEQFKEGCSLETIEKSQKATQELLERFQPLFKKYIKLLKGGSINYSDPEMKMFVYLFIEDRQLLNQLKRKKQTKESKQQINNRFNFIRETYGSLTEEEILKDLYVLFLKLAKRYKQKGRSFCGYIYNSFKFEVARFIKKHTKDPINISYKNSEFKKNMNGLEDDNIKKIHEDKYYENELGLPNIEWLNGEACSDVFLNLSNLERKILVKYYLEEWSDRQISERLHLDMSVSTINQIRRGAAIKIADKIGKDEDDIVRRRKSGVNLQHK